MSEEAFIYEAIRTPRGKQRNGSLNEVKPVNLVVGLIDELRSRHPDCLLEAADGPKIATGTRFKFGNRYNDLDVREGGELKRRRQYANNGVRHVIQHDALAQHVRGAAKPAHPESVPDQGDGNFAGLFLLIKRAA